MLMQPRGVYGPQGDSHLLKEALERAAAPNGARVLDVCTGTGVIALTAARLGAREVQAVDTSYRAVLTARCNVWLARPPAPVRVRHGDFRTCLTGQRFDVITANPPYVPCPGHERGRSSLAGAWDAGPDGRQLLDVLCVMAPELLDADGTLLMVHSDIARPALTLRMLSDAGLKSSIVARRTQPFGPVLRSRAAWLEQQGLIAPGRRHEELVVIRADRGA
ncbi:HemK2/MTQ2 family protein methyltransferase [Streptomyces sp. SP18CS02]|uniref:HemK2/MTQ2 family protein methyltransferase n=1 Tax=Streptomyces sp. SP18CS02 TaxID=3002531 RepID=UPI002E79162B|nr:HemK2/MTQ2 family protein methyltransferase [Streptomyces sp. SP18CS02]MEE1757443.1 methyltransferase [Streptomyces sp. SP18CS02]